MLIQLCSSHSEYFETNKQAKKKRSTKVSSILYLSVYILIDIQFKLNTFFIVIL